jgi:hypothetical protein
MESAALEYSAMRARTIRTRSPGRSCRPWQLMNNKDVAGARIWNSDARLYRVPLDGYQSHRAVYNVLADSALLTRCIDSP